MRNTLNANCLLDTNILVYAHDRKSSFYPQAAEIMKRMVIKGRARIAQQNIVEFCNILVREYEVSYASVVDDIEKLLLDIPVIRPLSGTLSIYITLLKKTSIKSKRIFDLYLAATMFSNGISTIITANDKDFKGIKGIKVYNPWGKKGKIKFTKIFCRD